MGTIKDRNGTDLTKVEDTKKRWQEYIEELYKRDFYKLASSYTGIITYFLLIKKN